MEIRWELPVLMKILGSSMYELVYISPVPILLLVTLISHSHELDAKNIHTNWYNQPFPARTQN